MLIGELWSKSPQDGVCLDILGWANLDIANVMRMQRRNDCGEDSYLEAKLLRQPMTPVFLSDASPIRKL